MINGLYRIEMTGLAGFAAVGRHFSRLVEIARAKALHLKWFGVLAVMLVGLAWWALMSGQRSHPTDGEPIRLATATIFCSFNREDGSHLTNRRRMIHETVNRKSRKTFARVHVGFVNVNAERAKCSLVTASRA